MCKTKWVVLVALGYAMNVLPSHALRSVGHTQKTLTQEAFKSSIKLVLNNSVGMLQARVTARTVLVNKQVEKKCAKK